MSSSTKLVRTMTRVCGRSRADAPDRLDAVDARHDEVDERDVGRQARDGLRPPPRRRRPRRRPRCRPGGRGTSRRPWRTTAWSSAMRTRITAAPRGATVVPAPGRESMLSVPPSARARSSIEVRPRRRERSAGLGGVEADAVVGDGDAQAPVDRVAAGRRRALASAWRSAFCSASWAMRRTSRRRSARGSASPSRLQRDRRRRGRAAARRRACAASWRGPRSRASGGRSSKISERSSSIASRASSCRRRSWALRLVGVAVEQRRRGLGGERERRRASA